MSDEKTILEAAKARAAKRKASLAPKPALVGSPPDPAAKATGAPVITGIKPKMNKTEDGVDIHGVPLIGRPLDLEDDLSPLLRYFGLNPANFEVQGNTFSTWQQSCNVNGERDFVWLYAFKARSISAPADSPLNPVTLDAWRTKHINEPRLHTPLYLPTGATYKIKIADPQFGKKGTAIAVENYKRGVAAHLQWAQMLRDNMGIDITNLHISWLGDEVEGVCNNYAGQAHTVELNFSDQVTLDFDMRCWTIDQAAALGMNLSASSVISNHGEHSRNGGKDVATTIGDNTSTMVANLVRKHYEAVAPYTGLNIDWTIGADSTPGITYLLSGVLNYDTHGYIEKGKGQSVEHRMVSAFREQVAGQPEKFGDVQIVDAAHNHHDWTLSSEKATVFGNPAIEAEKSSEWFLDSRGKWSRAGVRGCVISDQYVRGYAHDNIF